MLRIKGRDCLRLRLLSQLISNTWGGRKDSKIALATDNGSNQNSWFSPRRVFYRFCFHPWLKKRCNSLFGHRFSRMITDNGNNQYSWFYPKSFYRFRFYPCPSVSIRGERKDLRPFLATDFHGCSRITATTSILGFIQKVFTGLDFIRVHLCPSVAKEKILRQCWSWLYPKKSRQIFDLIDVPS